MFATSKTFLLTVGLLFFAINTNAKSSNRFQKIAEEYNVFAYSLDYGYPLHYKVNDKPILGIIYLSNTIDSLKKINEKTFIVQPSIENAQLIARNSDKINEYTNAKYYLVVDRNISQIKMEEFIKELLFDMQAIDICFVGGNGKYIPVNYFNWRNINGCYDGRYSNSLEVLINSTSDFLINGSFESISTVDSITYHYYNHNIEKAGQDDQNYDRLRYNLLDKRKTLNEIEHFREDLETVSNIHYVKLAIERCEKELELINKFKEVLRPHKSFSVIIETIYLDKIETWYQTIDQIQKGVHLIRSDYYRKRFGGNYLGLFYYHYHNPIYLELLEYSFPDKIMVEFGFEPPIFEEVEEVKEKPVPPVIPIGCNGTISSQHEPSTIPRHIEVTETEEELGTLELEDSL